MKTSFTSLIIILFVLFRVSAFAAPDLEFADSLNLEEYKFFKNPFSSKDKKKTASSESSIAGATLFYNLNGKNIDNLVGAANVKLNTASNFTEDFRLNVVGNITKVAGELNKEDISNDLLKLVQSDQGLSVGLEPTYRFLNKKGKQEWTTRMYGALNYKTNVFKDVVDDKGDSSNVNFDQGRLVVGFEAEGIKFDDDNFLYIGAELGVSMFSKEKYKQVFGGDKRALWGTEVTVGVPLFNKLKVLFKHTWAFGKRSTLSAGIILTGKQK